MTEPTADGVEWRVQWRRADWGPGTSKARRFARRTDLDAFVRKLHRGWADASPVNAVRISWRHVGRWQDE